MTLFDPLWQAVPTFAKQHHLPLLDKISALRQHNVIYPPQADIFRALRLTPLTAVSVIILGQDPYHGEGQAQGLSFSVPQTVKTPPSLRNIFKEIHRDLQSHTPSEAMSSDLSRWAKQGVLLLNTILTVATGKPGSHQKLGWQEITDDIIQTVNETQQHCVFMLWGKHAQKKRPLLSPEKHLILETSHPSPLGAYRGFNGCGHFSQANAYLAAHGREPINWE